MDEDEFWRIIARCDDESGGDMVRKSQLVRASVADLTKDDAQDFLDIFNDKMDEAYCYELWGAAYAINDGCGDDTFLDFRSSLISRGRPAYERALNDPESLAEESLDETQWFYEGFQYAISDAVKSRIGSRPRRKHPAPAQPRGEKWSQSEISRLYPRLTAKFGG